ncbi:MAG: helix-turn-helix transcriptional regulator [Rhodospirillaceae bacterium]|nr:helix-turn-helix transcriptional regulator [Rhodospirillaceae bacterium]
MRRTPFPQTWMAELEARIEDLEDSIRFMRTENEETFPHSLVVALTEGGNPVRVFRKHRKLTLKQLSAATAKHGRRVDVAYLSQIETGKKPGSISAYKALAAALKVDLDMLV